MPDFIIETEVNPAAERCAAAAHAAGLRVVRWSPGDAIPRVCDPIFLGSLTACGAMPGVVGDPAHLRVSHWLPAVRDIALNADVMHSTVGAVAEIELPWPRVFVRPDSAMKPFSGRVLDRGNLSPAALDHGFYYDDLDLPVVLAEARAVAHEWRFVAVDRRIVAYGGYIADGRAAADRALPDAALRLAEDAARRAPEPSIVIDICALTDGGLRLVEFNLLSGSDLYDCDAAAVVTALAAARRRTDQSPT